MPEEVETQAPVAVQQDGDPLSTPEDADAKAVASEPAFDLGSKKKKKKKKAGAGADADIAPSEIAEGLDALALADAAAAAEAAALASGLPQEFAPPDFSAGVRKKRKKKVFFEEDALDDGSKADAGTGENGERVSRREVDPQPWDGSDRDYTYEELLARAMVFLHGKKGAPGAGTGGRKKVSLQFPQVAREGTKKTVFLNFGAICKSIHRQQDHLLAFLGAELGTSGNIQDGGRLVIKGRFTAEGIANVLKKYMMDYVICQSCMSPDTVLMRDANTRLYFVSCESCGAHRSVSNISAGYVARVTRRKKT